MAKLDTAYVEKDGKHRLNFFSEIKEIPEVFNTPYIPSLDGLRAVSIAMVIIFHILMSFRIPYELDNFANLGVQFFFVISGFLITTLLIKEKITHGNISLKNFYIRRAYRILPVAYLYLLVVLIANFVLKLHLDLFLLLTSFLFIRNFYKRTTGANHIATHYWSLSVEEQFYIIFPFILKKNFKVYVYFLLGMLTFTLLIDFVTVSLALPVFHTTAVKMIFTFINQFQGITVGSITAILLFKYSSFFYRLNKVAVTLGSLLIIILLTLYIGAFANFVNFFRCAFFALILVLNITEADNFIFKLLNNGVVKLIGILSFSIYIWQQPLTQGLNIINKSSLLNRFDNKIPIDILITVVCLVALGIISYVSYYYFEKKFLALRKRYR